MDCSKCHGAKFEQVSETCPTCGGDGEIVDSNGTVKPCPNPRCFWGSVAVSYPCSRCGGTGKEP